MLLQKCSAMEKYFLQWGHSEFSHISTAMLLEEQLGCLIESMTF